MRSQLIGFVWTYWGQLRKDLLLYVWNRLDVMEIIEIASNYIPNLSHEKIKLIEQLSEHFFKPNQEDY